MDILLVKLGALGDVINALPLAVRLKRQLDARIHWLVAPLSFPLISGHPSVDRAILFDIKNEKTSWPGVLRRLRRQRFDIVLDLQRILKSGLISLVADAGRRIGFDRQRCKEMTWLLPLERIPPADPNRHMVLQYLEFADYLGISATGISWGIRSAGLSAHTLPKQFVVLNIGATKPANRWPAEEFSGLAELLHLLHHMPCVLTGGPEDAPMAHRIQSSFGEGIINLVGKTSLPELVDVINAAVAVVTCDTGPMHLASALGKPVVALFGPSDHRRTGPYRGQVIRSPIDCAPCHRKRCATPECMTAIRPETVLAALGDALHAVGR